MTVRCFFKSCFYSCVLAVKNTLSDHFTWTHVYKSRSAVSTTEIPEMQVSDHFTWTHVYKSCSAVSTTEIPEMQVSDHFTWTHVYKSCSAVSTTEIPEMQVSDHFTWTHVYKSCSAVSTTEIPEMQVSDHFTWTHVYKSRSAVSTTEIPEMQVSTKILIQCNECMRQWCQTAYASEKMWPSLSASKPFAKQTNQPHTHTKTTTTTTYNLWPHFQHNHAEIIAYSLGYASSDYLINYFISLS